MMKNAVTIYLHVFTTLLTVVGSLAILGQPPHIYQSPYDRLLFMIDAQGNRTSLTQFCGTAGDPQPTVTWFRNDQPVNTRYVMDDGSLVIPNITEGEFASRSGVTYYCVANNTVPIGNSSYTAAARSNTAKVTYAFFGGFTGDVEPNVQVAFGSDVALKCDVAESIPAPEIEWFNDPDPNADTPLRIGRDPGVSFLENGRYLLIGRVTEQQIEKQYRCHVTNAEKYHRRISPTVYTLNASVPLDGLVTYKTIGELTAFVGGGETEFYNVEFSYIAAAPTLFEGTPPIISMSCHLLHPNGNSTLLFTPGNVGFIRRDEIPQPSAENNEYTISCDVQSSQGLTNATGFLHVYQQAAITSAPENNREYLVGDTETIVFKCEVVGVPTPTVVFYYNSQPVRSGGGYGIIIDLDNNTLTISDPAPSHSGVYQCSASNFVATDLRTWILEIRERTPPIVLDWEVSNIIPSIRSEFYLVCTFDGVPRVTVEWTIDNQTLVSNENNSILIIKRRDIPDTQVTTRVTVQKIEKNHDIGVYTCTAENEAGKISHSFSHLFTAPPVVLNWKVSDKNPRIGSHFYMLCVFNGVPRVTVEWTKDNQTLVESNDNVRIVINKRDDIPDTQVTTMMTVELTEKNDSGVYTCTAENEIGRISQSFEIQLFTDAIPATQPGPSVEPEAAVSAGVIVGAVIGALLGILLVCVLILVLVYVLIHWRMNKRHRGGGVPYELMMPASVNTAATVYSVST